MIIEAKIKKYEPKLKKWAKNTNADIIQEDPLKLRFSNAKFDEAYNAMKISKKGFVQRILTLQVNKIMSLMKKSIESYVPKGSYEIYTEDDFQ